MNHSDADIGLADIDIPHLLIEQLLGECLLRIGLEFADRDVGAGAHRAGRLRIGRVDPGLRLGLRLDPDQQARQRRQNPNEPFHEGLPVFPACMHGLSALPSAPFTARIRMNEDSVTAP